MLDAPAHKVAEVIDGVLYTMPRPAVPHSIASTTLVWKLASAFRDGSGGAGGWWMVFDPELHLGENILVPDLAGWRRERVPRYFGTAYYTLPPD